jgi:pentatricopeptide repeat protein
VSAAPIFEEIGFYSQAGEALYLLGDYTRAASLYSEGGMVTKAVECYKLMRNWDAILNCVKEHA